MKGKNGRPTKLTPAIQEQIVGDIKAGNYAEVAAKRAGIDRTTFFTWMQKGETASCGEFRDFHDAIRIAEGHAEVRAVTVVAAAMPGDWKAASWYLERKWHDRWGRRQVIEHTGTDGQPVAPMTFTLNIARANVSPAGVTGGTPFLALGSKRGRLMADALART